MYKKIIVICIVVLGFAGCFFAGYFSRQNGFNELEGRVEEFGNILKSKEATIVDLNQGLSESNDRVGELTAEVDRLAKQNNSLTEKLGDIGAGLSGDINSIRRIAEGIDFYLQEAQE